MKTDARVSDPLKVVAIDGRSYLPVRWEDADVLHETLRKGGCPTTVCLNPETREARLELWPEVTPDAVRAVLKGRPAGVVKPSLPADRARESTTDSAADLVCI
jgi:hypothetical protein